VIQVRVSQFVGEFPGKRSVPRASDPTPLAGRLPNRISSPTGPDDVAVYLRRWRKTRIRRWGRSAIAGIEGGTIYSAAALW
jgi:hypothetical protein